MSNNAIDIARRLDDLGQTKEACTAYTLALHQSIGVDPEQELECAIYLFQNGEDYKVPYTIFRDLYNRGYFCTDILPIMTEAFYTPNINLMKNHLVALKEGLTIRSPRYNFVTCESDPNGDEKKPAKVILTEGLYVLNEGVRDIMDVKVYVFTPLEVIKERWYKRAAERGKTGEAADLQFADVNKTAQQYIRPAYQISDAVINGLVSQEYIQQITDKIFYALKNIEY